MTKYRFNGPFSHDGVDKIDCHSGLGINYINISFRSLRLLLKYDVECKHYYTLYIEFIDIFLFSVKCLLYVHKLVACR